MVAKDIRGRKWKAVWPVCYKNKRKEGESRTCCFACKRERGAAVSHLLQICFKSASGLSGQLQISAVAVQGRRSLLPSVLLRHVGGATYPSTAARVGTIKVNAHMDERDIKREKNFVGLQVKGFWNSRATRAWLAR
nr:hypothetical protein Iba_scaffold6462CG0100 [Ipomoea batatas]